LNAADYRIAAAGANPGPALSILDAGVVPFDVITMAVASPEDAALRSLPPGFKATRAAAEPVLLAKFRGVVDT
jgi:hypothetical protein